ncbi:MAG: TVP38/TMEM64 family protein [Acutalibacteraceae bacterium]
MSFKNLTSEEKRSRILRRMGVGCFICSILVIFAMYLTSLPQIRVQLSEINAWFTRIELFIAQYDKLDAVAVILFFFLVKTFLGFIPFSVLFIGTGLVFSPTIAVLINVIGYSMLILIKFLWGRRFGGGGVHKLLLKSDSLTAFMDFHGKGNKWMLVVLRFVPAAPVGTVSRAYGATDMKIIPFLILSNIGFLPRLIMWSIIGCNVFDPFTPSFLTPLAVLLAISGISLLLLDTLFKLIRKDDINAKK